MELTWFHKYYTSDASCIQKDSDVNEYEETANTRFHCNQLDDVDYVKLNKPIDRALELCFDEQLLTRFPVRDETG